MLSKKQLWRKVITSPRPVPRNDNDDPNSMDIINNDTIIDNKQNSPIKGVTPRKLRSAMSLSNLSEMEKLLRPKEQRNIRFSATVHVCLIPTRQEMKLTIDELFWKPCDYNTFKTEAVAELKALLTSQGLTPKQAITELYQPNDQDREEYNMIIENYNEFKDNTIDDNDDRMIITIDDKTNNVMNVESDNNQQLEIKFITAIKTDVELNEVSIAGSPNRTSSHLPTHTPSGGQQLSHVWTVNWKKNSDHVN